MKNYGFDIDDTTGDFTIALLPYAFEYDRKLRNTGVVDASKYISRGMFDWSKEEIIYFFRKYAPIAAVEMKVKDDAVEVLTLLKEQGDNIFFISARGPKHYENAYQISYDWLTHNEAPFDEIIVEAYDKILVCREKRIHRYMDDIASICDKVSNEDIDTYLVNTKYNAYYQEQKVKRVNNWKEFYRSVRGKE